MPNAVFSQAAVLPGAERRLNAAERNFWRAFGLTVAIVLVFQLSYHVERNVLGRQPGDIRFIREATEAAMRYITIPHIVIGFLFLASAPKNRNLRKRLWIIGLLLAGALLCTVYGTQGGKANVILTVGVYLYFLVHEMRDEAMFYQVLGDAPPIADRAAFQRMVRALIGVLIFNTAALGWIGAPLGLYHRHGLADYAAFSWAARIGMALGPAVVGALATAAVLRHYAPRLGFRSVGDMLRTHAPMFRLCLGVLMVLGLSLLLTQRPYSLILFHVTGWYVFASCQFRRNPPKTPPASRWLWMRTTFAGFQSLHVGMVVGLMALGLVWTLALDCSPALNWLLAPESFLYWTIMHITVSFVPR